jgi:hypothetical protein
MGEIIPLFPVAGGRMSGPWRAGERSILDAFAARFAAGSPWGVDTTTGVAEAGDPWMALCDPRTGEVLVHVARVGGRYIVLGPEGAPSEEGGDLRELLRRFQATSQAHAGWEGWPLPLAAAAGALGGLAPDLAEAEPSAAPTGRAPRPEGSGPTEIAPAGAAWASDLRTAEAPPLADPAAAPAVVASADPAWSFVAAIAPTLAKGPGAASSHAEGPLPDEVDSGRGVAEVVLDRAAGDAVLRPEARIAAGGHADGRASGGTGQAAAPGASHPAGKAGEAGVEAGSGADGSARAAEVDRLADGASNGTLAGCERLVGGAGTDSLAGGAGADRVAADAAADSGAGGDTLVGGAAGDTLAGDAGADSLAGDTGDDTLAGDAGADSLAGGEGDDVASGGAGGDSVAGGTGDDTLAGGAGGDSLAGGEGDDSLSGGDGRDSLEGGDGVDTLSLGGGDVASGGAGSDRFEVILPDPSEPVLPLAVILDFSLAEDLLSWRRGPAGRDERVTLDRGGADATGRIRVDFDLDGRADLVVTLRLETDIETGPGEVALSVDVTLVGGREAADAAPAPPTVEAVEAFLEVLADAVDQEGAPQEGGAIPQAATPPWPDAAPPPAPAAGPIPEAWDLL